MRIARRTNRLALLSVGAVAAGALAAHRARSGEPPGISARVPSLRTAPSSLSTAGRGAAESTGAPLLVGDRDLLGSIDLDRATLDGDRYSVELPDGRRAMLTLDPALQKEAESVLARAKAPMAAIVVVSTDGRILALAGRRNQAPARERDFDLPVSVWAPAASIFKIVTATSLIEQGLTEKTTTCYHGGLRSVDKSHLVDDSRRDKTCGTLAQGMAQSQNAMIGKLAHKHLSREILADSARDFGFGSAPQFALDTEANRFLFPEDPLEFARVSAGFWSTELSPLGGALIANIIATRGMSVTPRIVDELRGNGAVVPVVAKAPVRVVDAAVAERVAVMMRATVDEGTARKGFIDPNGRRFLGGTSVAGKTGSLTRGTPSYLAYSWFVGFAPVEEPEVSIAVLLGNPEKWYLKASTAARLVLDERF